MRDPVRMGQTSTKKGPEHVRKFFITLPIRIIQVYPMMGDIVRTGPIHNQNWTQGIMKIINMLYNKHNSLGLAMLDPGTVMRKIWSGLKKTEDQLGGILE